MPWFTAPWFSTPLASFRAAGGWPSLERRIRSARCRPSRLTLVAAAVTVAAVVAAVIVAGVSAGGASPAQPAGNPDAAGQGRPAGVASQPRPGQAGQAGQAAGQAAGQHQAGSSPPEQPARPVAAVPPHSAAPAPSPAAPAQPAQPYLIYDSVTPEAIPPGHMIATYATGNEPTTAAALSGRGPVLWIDVTGTDYAASALDVEPGNVGPAQAAVWAFNRLTLYPDAIAHIYTFKDEWPAVQAAVAATVPPSMQSRVHWWIADPTGVPHMVPGAQATQWYWGPGYDISTAMPGF
jgi:hypothetical protein